MRPGRFFNNRSLRIRRRELRATLTVSEAALWRFLQRSRLLGRKFRRQHAIGPYVVDFYCPAERLVVELDGSAHDSERSVVRDEIRERFLNDAGLTVLRIENRHVLENAEGVLEVIRQKFR